MGGYSIEVCLSGSGHPACGRRRLDGQALSPRWVRQRVGLLVGLPPRGRPHCWRPGTHGDKSDCPWPSATEQRCSSASEQKEKSGMITELMDMRLPAASYAPAKPLTSNRMRRRLASSRRIESRPSAASPLSISPTRPVLYNVMASMTLAHSTGIPV